MRKFTVALLVAGCVALGLGTGLLPTASSSLSTTVYAQASLHDCRVECGQAADHYAFCHVDRGGAGHVICPDSSSIAKHIANHQPDGDQCISDVFTVEDCEGKK